MPGTFLKLRDFLFRELRNRLLTSVNDVSEFIQIQSFLRV